MDEKLEEIKKQINTKLEASSKTTIIVKGEDKKEGREEEELPANLNRLATIQEQEEEFNSFRVFPVEGEQLSDKK